MGLHRWLSGFVGAFFAILFFACAHPALAVTRTWDGGGTDGACGGQAGDGNKWSCAANWSGDTIPGASDVATFNSTSTKNATINQAFSIQTININSGYTGIVTQASDLTLSINFTHNTTNGTYTWSSGTLTFSGGSAAAWDVDTGDDTFGAVTISKSTGVNVTVTSGDTAVVTSTLTLTDGNINTGIVEARSGVTHGAGFDGGTGTLNITQGATDVNLTASGQLPLTTLSASRVINGPASGTTTFDGRFTVSSGSYVGSAGDLTLTGGLTVSGGSFNGGSGAIDNNGTFVLSGVGTTFTSTTGTFFNSSTFTHTDSSTFTHNSGTVTFDGSSATIDVNASETFGNLNFNATTSATKTISSGDTLIVTGTLTLSDGNINTGTVEARDTITPGAGFDGGSALLNITQGSTDINLVAGGQMPAVTLAANRIINGVSSGTVIFDGDFILTNGSFVGGAGDLDLNGTSTTQGLSISSPASFTAPSGTMTVSGGFQHLDSSTFNTNSGTINFDPAGTVTINVNVSETFNNLIFGSPSIGAVSVGDSGNDVLIVEGTLSFLGGYVDGTSASSVEIDARGDIIQGGTSEGGSAKVSFGNDLVAQTWTVNDAEGPMLFLDSAADANDTVTFAAAGNLYGVTTTPAFSGNIPIDNASNYVIGFERWNQVSGTYDASAQSSWQIGSFVYSGGSFTPPPLVTVGFSAGDWDVQSTFTFTNFTVDPAGGVMSFVDSDTLVILGTLSLTTGSTDGTGVFDTRGNTVYGALFGGGNDETIIDFGNDAVAQSLTLNGGVGLITRFNSAADASDSILLGGGYSEIDGIYITSDFVGAIPITNPDDSEFYAGQWHQQAGTYDASADSFWDFEDFDISGGSFLAPDTVTVANGGGTWDVNGTQTFRNIQMELSSAIFYLAAGSGDRLIVNGDAYFASGQLNADLEIRGNAFFDTGFDGGTGGIILNGTGTQLFGPAVGVAGSRLFDGDLTINKTAGYVSLDSDFVMDAAGQDFSLLDGTFATGGIPLSMSGVGSTFTVADGARLELVTNDISFTGVTPSFGVDSTVYYEGWGDETFLNVLTTSYGNLLLDTQSFDVYQFGANLDINGDLQVFGCMLDVGAGESYTLNIAGDFDLGSDSSFDAQTGTVTFDGTGNQAITGDNTFYNLAKTRGGEGTLTLGAGYIQTVTNSLTLQGTTPSSRLLLRSSLPGTQVAIDPQGSVNVRNLDVKDSNNISADVINCLIGCRSSGNNLNWNITNVGSSNTPIELSYISPATGAKLHAGDTTQITWSSSASAGSFVNIDISTDGGLSFAPLFTNLPNTGSVDWIVPEVDSQAVFLSLVTTNGILAIAGVDSPMFTIIGTPVINPVPDTDGFTHTFVRGKTSPAVYYIDADFVRHAVLNEATYFTYEDSWEAVTVVHDSQLSDYPLGSILLPKPGVVLVKFYADNRVYALEAQGEKTLLRHIENERQAEELYGTNWAAYVIDIDPVFWGKFTLGDPLPMNAEVDRSLLKKRDDLHD
jgi:hypothetical protein